MHYIDRLILSCSSAKKAIPCRVFPMINISDLKDVKTAIYIIREIDGDPSATFIKYSEYRKSKTRACAKLNSPSSVMYVGSSTTSVCKRIAQHIGDGPTGTYALHLNQWFRGKYTIEIREYDEPREVLQIIEDDLSDQLQPAFGKQGGNSK